MNVIFNCYCYNDYYNFLFVLLLMVIIVGKNHFERDNLNYKKGECNFMPMVILTHKTNTIIINYNCSQSSS